MAMDFINLRVPTIFKAVGSANLTENPQLHSLVVSRRWIKTHRGRLGRLSVQHEEPPIYYITFILSEI